MRVEILAAPEAQRIGYADHLGAHAQNVAHDTADSGRRAFERNDLRGMVVRLVRDDDSVSHAVVRTEVQDARVLARSEDRAQRFGGKARKK